MQVVTVDIGNTNIKVAWFCGDIVSRVASFPACDFDWRALRLDAPRAVMVSASGALPAAATAALGAQTGCLRVLSPDTPLPIAIRYRTPRTLGLDRVAAACGADALFPGADILVIDAGTAVTFDLVSGGAFVGGNISAGVSLRLRALSANTDKLPQVDIDAAGQELLGGTTAEALARGAIQGVRFEAEGYIRRLSGRYPGLRVVATGGAAGIFADMPKRAIFVDPILVHKGLKRILTYNEGI